MKPVPPLPLREGGKVRGNSAGSSWLATALLLVCNCCPASGEPALGRLFTTPEQRQRLQQLRERHGQTLSGQDGLGRHDTAATAGPGPGNPATGAAAADAPVVTLRGLIYRQGRARVAWTGSGDRTVTLDYPGPGVETGPGAGFAVPVSAHGKSVTLKPGQSWRPDSGAVTDTVP